MTPKDTTLTEKIDEILIAVLRNLHSKEQWSDDDLRKVIEISGDDKSILSLINSEVKKARIELIDKIEQLQRYDEGDGWDIAFGQSDRIKMLKNGTKKVVKRGKDRSCCPGDDIAYVRNYTLDEVLDQLKENK